MRDMNRNVWIISQIFFNRIIANTLLAGKQLLVRACRSTKCNLFGFRNYSPRRYSSSDAWNTQERSLKGNEMARGERRASGARTRQSLESSLCDRWECDAAASRWDHPVRNQHGERGIEGQCLTWIYYRPRIPRSRLVFLATTTLAVGPPVPPDRRGERVRGTVSRRTRRDVRGWRTVTFSPSTRWEDTSFCRLISNFKKYMKFSKFWKMIKYVLM